MAKSQKTAPLWEAVRDYCGQNLISFHTPGHKGGCGLDPELTDLAGRFARLDQTELPGLDNLHAPNGPIQEAQELAAEACGAAESFFLVNGSSCGVQAMLLAACRPGDKVIIPRDAHISVHSGLVSAGAEPVYIYPMVDNRRGLTLGVTEDHLREVLTTNPEVKAVLLLNPNYYGICSNLTALAKTVKEFGKILLVDEAHGAHLPFHPALPPTAAAAGADLWVQSTHKTGVSLTQSAILHQQGGRIDPHRLRAALRLVQSTSPSYLLLVSLDLSRRLLAVRGRAILERLIISAGEIRSAVARVNGLSCLKEPDLPAGEGFRLDPLKILVDFGGIGLAGREAAEYLRKIKIEPELSLGNHVLFMLAPGTKPEDCRLLTEACAAVALDFTATAPAGNISAAARTAAARTAGPRTAEQKCLPGQNKDCLTATSNNQSKTVWTQPITKQVLPPREAWFAATRTVKLAEAVGLVAGEAVTPYPPGIPLVCPGEEISREAAARIAEFQQLIKIIG